MIALSKSESELTGLRILRGIEYFETLDVAEFRKALLHHHADWCKVRVNAADHSLFNKLDSLGLPYFISSVIFKNEIIIGKEHAAAEIPPDISIELYDDSQQKELTSLIKAVAKEPVGVYYNNEMIDRFLSEELEDKINTAYILSFSHNTDAAKYAWLLRVNKEPAGYFMGFARGKTFEGALYGIHPSFRGMGLARVVYQMMLKICAENGFEKFENGVHTLNYRSLSPTVREGVVPKAMYFYVTVYPFISFAERNCKAVIKTPAEKIMNALCQTFENSVIDLSWRFFATNALNQNIQITISDPIRMKQSSVQILFATNQKQEICGHGIIRLP